VTNVTYLPWVTPENPETDSSTSVGESASSRANTSIPEQSQPAARVSFTEADEDEHIAALSIDDLEATLLRKLHSHDMSVREVTDWLRENDAAEGDAFALVEKFERLGYLNDERLALELCARLSERKGKSRSIVARELRQRGLAQAAIDVALDSIDSDVEGEKAVELAMQRVRQFSSLDDDTAQRRLHGFLSRRGYAGDVVRSAVSAAMATRTGGHSANRAPRFR
jgi:regulatory protein